MGLSARKREKRFTYGDYLHWPDDERWELIDGVAQRTKKNPQITQIFTDLIKSLYFYL